MSQQPDSHRHRVHESGAAKRKKAEEKADRPAAVIAKTPTIDQWYKGSSASSYQPQTEDENEEGVQTEDTTADDTEVDVTEGTGIDDNKDVEFTAVAAAVPGLADDVGLRPGVTTGEIVDYWAKHGPSERQHCDEQLFKQTSENQELLLQGDYSRSQKCMKTLFERTSMGQGRLISLTLMNIESDILRQLSIDEIVDDFASQKARRVNMTKITSHRAAA